ncbi:MAG: NADH-quinone oxidoreductase subunit M [Candidatus Bathyarchaeia archaeon]
MAIDTCHLLLQTIALPILFSIIAFFIGKAIKERVGWLVFIVMAYVSIIMGIIVYRISTGALENGLKASYEWGPYLGSFTLIADGLSAPIAFIIALLSAFIAIYSMEYMKHEHGIEAYFALYLLYVAGMLGTVLATNLAAFFIFFELMLIPSWILIAVWGTGAKESVAFKYFMFTEAGALSLLAGILTIRFISGTFDVFAIASRLEGINKAVMVIIVASMLIGLFIKMAIFPLHTWLPDAHAEAPTPISALLSPAMIGIGGYAIIRIMYTAFPEMLKTREFIIFVLTLAFITMIYGGIMALSQDDIKRLLAYSSISQMGYMLFGIGSTSILGITGATLLYISHGLCKAILFLVSGVLMHKFNTRSIKELGGLAGKMPYTATATLIGFLGLGGVPPLIGFWSEFYIFAGAIYSGFISRGMVNPDLTRILITGLAIIASVLTIAYGLWAMKKIFYGELPERFKDVKDAPLYMILPIMVLAALAIVLGIYPTIFNKAISFTIGEFIP